MPAWGRLMLGLGVFFTLLVGGGLMALVYVQDIDTYGVEDHLFISLGNILAWKAAPEFGAASDQALAGSAGQCVKK